MLAPQTAAQAYGPAGASGGKDGFRVTDLHQRKSGSSADVPAFAICDGLICAQMDAGTTLSLILKPTEQPPFDFPFISYIIYKGVDPKSLLALDGTIDTAQQTSNELITAIKTAWELAANGNTGSPSRACLGLHLNPTDFPAANNPARFADTEPLDRFFYDGDPAIQLPLVRGGWRLGKFSSSSSFGIEIIVERIGYRPRIALARKVENAIEVTSLDPAITYAPNDATYFTHWHAKEECLNFIDPCAFWGSFFATRLRVWDASSADFSRKTGSGIYSAVLFGGTSADQPGTDGNFFKRNCAYLDIRNEHGHSVNYYKAAGPNIQLTLDRDADIDTCEVDYYASGWPIFVVDGSPPVALPAGAMGDKIDLRFALPGDPNARSLIYVSAGYRKRFRRLKGPQRFIDRPRRDASPYLEEAAVTIPLTQASGPRKVAASYQKLCHFKRPLIDAQPVSASSSNSLSPTYGGPLDNLFPVRAVSDFVADTGQIQVKTWGDEFFIDVQPDQMSSLVARSGIGKDAQNFYLFMLPTAYSVVSRGTRRSPAMASLPANEFVDSGNFLQAIVATRTSRPLVKRTVVRPSPEDQSEGPVQVSIPDLSTKVSRDVRSASMDDILIVTLSLAELAAVNVLVNGPGVIPNSSYLTVSAKRAFGYGTQPYAETTLSVSFLDTQSALVVRATAPLSTKVYSDAYAD